MEMPLTGDSVLFRSPNGCVGTDNGEGVLSAKFGVDEFIAEGGPIMDFRSFLMISLAKMTGN